MRRLWLELIASTDADRTSKREQLEVMSVRRGGPSFKALS